MIRLNVDCLILIFNELQNKKFLYSCLLVNKEWCHLVIPILWKKYSWYHNYEETGKKPFNTILSCLPSSSKQLLSNNNINLPLEILSNPPLFNYVSFCKFPRAEIIHKIVVTLLGRISSHDKRNLLEQEIYKLFISQCKNIRELSWKTSQPLSLFPGASTCFSHLCNLRIDINFAISSKALYEMAQICKDLNELTIYNFSQDLFGLTSLIDAQRNLKSVKSVAFYPYIKKGSCEALSKALAGKGNTINDLSLYSVSIIQPTFLTSLINLKRILIYNGDYEDEKEEIKEFQRYLAISKFPVLQSLDVEGLSCFKELAMLIEKTEGNVSLIFIYTTNKFAENTGMLIKAIANNCPIIERLSTHLEPKDFIHVKSLLLNCRNLIYIEFDSLKFCANENDDIGDELLDILANFSPRSLTDITISGDWKCSIGAFERFFESCRERTLLYFGITHNKDYITQDHKALVRKYFSEGIINETNCV